MVHEVTSDRTIRELVSPDGRFRLIAEDSGNMVLYKKSSMIWASNTWTSRPNGPYSLRVQANGDLRLCDRTGTCIWHSNTWSPCPSQWYRLELRDTGNLELCDGDERVIWCTGTSYY